MKKLQISKRHLKGEDGYTSFSIRITEETAERLDSLARETNRSRNQLIGMLLEFGLDNCEITEREE